MATQNPRPDVHGEVRRQCSRRVGNDGDESVASVQHRIEGNVDIEDDSGGLSIADVNGDIRVKDGSGGLSVEHVVGTIHLRDGSGGIGVNDVDGNLIISDAGSGGIDYDNISGTVDVPRDN